MKLGALKMTKGGLFAIIAILVFAVGALFGGIISSTADSTSVVSSMISNLSDASQSPASTAVNPLERDSPSDWISENQIKVTKENVVVDIQNAVWATFTDTHSMEPVLSANANALEIVPTSTEQIHVGDIVSYDSKLVDGTIIHRVVEIGSDSQGWYATFKGDNLVKEDPEKVRWEQIRRIVVAIIY
jgi:hypothetical protein